MAFYVNGKASITAEVLLAFISEQNRRDVLLINRQFLDMARMAFLFTDLVINFNAISLRKEHESHTSHSEQYNILLTRMSLSQRCTIRIDHKSISNRQKIDFLLFNLNIYLICV